MANMLKDLAVLLFAAGDEIERKSEEFRKKREARYAEFDEKFKHTREKAKTRFEQDIEKARDGIRELSGKLGVASKDEIEELKKKIDDLSSKIDTLENKFSR